MNKKILITVGTLLVFAVAYWLLSPLWRNAVLQEELPGAATTSPIKDNLSAMDVDTKADFEQQTQEVKDMMMEKSETMPVNQPTIISRANMVARAHDVEGEALVVTTGNESFIRFENLNTINGPDLRIYLASDLSADDIVDLGPIRATQGSVNYAIPAGTDLEKYKNVMIWCRAFGVLFSYAQFE